MGFLAKTENSWAAFKSSLAVMGAHKKLLAFPVVISILTLAILFFFLGSIAIYPTGHAFSDPEHWKSLAGLFFTQESMAARSANPQAQIAYTGNGLVFIAVIYFISMFLATFFNVAFYHEILNALRGQAVSIRGGLKFALTRLPAIFMWSLFAGLVGYLIRILEEKMSLFGKLILAFIGVAWSVASVFVIPVIITREGANPVEMLRQSAGTLKKTWGEALVGFVGLQIGTLVVLLGSFALFTLAFFAAYQLEAMWLIAVAAVIWVISIFTFSYLVSVANQIYRCVLFVYATEGAIPAPFDLPSLNAAWKMK